MKSYTRIDDHGDYCTITDIDDHDNYYQRNVWTDGIVLNENRCKIQELGWKDFKDFKAHSLQFSRFTLTGC